MINAQESQVRDHFESISASYETSSQSLIWKFIRRRESKVILDCLPSLKGKRVLDACCGSGYYTRMLSDFGAREIAAVDLSSQMLSHVRGANIHTLVGDVNKMNFNDKFDLILCAGGLEFMNEPSEFFEMAARHVESGASLVLLVPIQGLAGKMYRHYHRRHKIQIRLFTSHDLSKLASPFGWRLELSRIAHPFAAALRYVKS